MVFAVKVENKRNGMDVVLIKVLQALESTIMKLLLLMKDCVGLAGQHLR